MYSSLHSRTFSKNEAEVDDSGLQYLGHRIGYDTGTRRKSGSSALLSTTLTFKRRKCVRHIRLICIHTELRSLEENFFRKVFAFSTKNAGLQ
ncbi:hypothetical protein CEXT_556611 [Caerostris extrusa]|uniref:Uncharacterized protein n=1 Tax=Caerostris extrusa TaxID=172846 RepID=A0AAV4SL41_CAEEX|nr:hypothetical protein CEXT_556611 [Caerostris extrusa]